MKNAFFQKALKEAAAIAGKKQRMLQLVTRFFIRLQTVKREEMTVSSVKSKASVFGRLARAYAQGHYRDISWSTMLIITAAIIYFVNPFDLVPDLIPVAGFTDDFGILLWVYNSIRTEINKYLAWEESRTTAI